MSETDQTRGGWSIGAIVVGISVVILLVANYSLLQHTSKLENSLEAQRSALAPQVGARVGPLIGWTLDGTEVEVSPASETRKTLLFAMSDRCGICTANWPFWEAIAAQMDPRRYTVVYANLSDSLPPEYVDRYDYVPGSHVLARVDPQSVVDYNLSLTPGVILIGRDGVVEKAWLGRTKPSWQGDMESTLGVSLAGVDFARPTASTTE